VESCLSILENGTVEILKMPLIESVHVAEMAFCMLPLGVSSIHAVNFWERVLWPLSLACISMVLQTFLFLHVQDIIFAQKHKLT
jgi:hypothetical protein